MAVLSLSAQLPGVVRFSFDETDGEMRAVKPEPNEKHMRTPVVKRDGRTKTHGPFSEQLGLYLSLTY